MPPSLRSSGFTGSISNLPKWSSFKGGMLENTSWVRNDHMAAEGNADRNHLEYPDGLWLSQSLVSTHFPFSVAFSSASPPQSNQEESGDDNTSFHSLLVRRRAPSGSCSWLFVRFTCDIYTHTLGRALISEMMAWFVWSCGSWHGVSRPAPSISITWELFRNAKSRTYWIRD